MALLTTLLFLRDLLGGGATTALTGQIALWLWFTVLFANFAEALAEGQGEARADSLRATQQEAPAKRLAAADGEAGSDRSSVIGGTGVVSDQLVVRVTQEPGESFLDKMIALVEDASRQKTPNEVALDILLVGMTIIFLIVVVTLEPFAVYAGTFIPLAFPVALLVTLIPTTIGGLLVRHRHRRHGTGRRGPTSSPSRTAPSRRRATSTYCSSTRPVRSPSATAWPRASSRCRAWRRTT